MFSIRVRPDEEIVADEGNGVVVRRPDGSEWFVDIFGREPADFGEYEGEHGWTIVGMGRGDHPVCKCGWVDYRHRGSILADHLRDMGMCPHCGHAVHQDSACREPNVPDEPGPCWCVLPEWIEEEENR